MSQFEQLLLDVYLCSKLRRDNESLNAGMRLGLWTKRRCAGGCGKPTILRWRYMCGRCWRLFREQEMRCEEAEASA